METVEAQEKVEAQAPAIDESKVKEFIYKLQMQQNFPLGLMAGIVSSIIGAIVWAGITALTNYQIGWMAVGVGFLVGISVRTMGKGIDKQYGYMGATFSLLGCLLGNLFTVLIMYSKENSTSFMTVLTQLDYARIPNIMFATFQPMDVLFYGLAIYEGYKFAFRKIDQSELESLTNKA
jgi:hypothetical protein